MNDFPPLPIPVHHDTPYINSLVKQDTILPPPPGKKTNESKPIKYDTRLMDYQKQTDLVLPEYGRNIQRMVDHCLTIENRTDRTRCARSIISTMENLFPHLRQPEFRHKPWDHLAIMSDFKLDIEWPYEVIRPEELSESPHPIPYNTSSHFRRHYGRIIEEMISYAITMAEGPEKNAFVLATANQMKRSYVSWNKDTVSDETILNDLREQSDGKLILDPSTTHLIETRELLAKPARQHLASSSRTRRRKRQ